MVMSCYDGAAGKSLCSAVRFYTEWEGAVYLAGSKYAGASGRGLERKSGEGDTRGAIGEGDCGRFRKQFFEEIFQTLKNALASEHTSEWSISKTRVILYRAML